MWRRRTHLLGGGGNKDCGATQPATALSAGAWRRFWARSGVRVRHPGRSSHRLGAGSDVMCAPATLRLDLRRRSSPSSEHAPEHHSAGHSAVSWHVTAVLGTIRGLCGASGAQEPSSWGWIRRDVRSCDASARFSSPQHRFRPSKHRSTTQPATALSTAWWWRFRARSGVRVGHPGRRSHRLWAGSDVVCAVVARRCAEGSRCRRRWRVRTSA